MRRATTPRSISSVPETYPPVRPRLWVTVTDVAPDVNAGDKPLKTVTDLLSDPAFRKVVAELAKNPEAKPEAKTTAPAEAAGTNKPAKSDKVVVKVDVSGIPECGYGYAGPGIDGIGIAAGGEEQAFIFFPVGPVGQSAAVDHDMIDHAVGIKWRGLLGVEDPFLFSRSGVKGE